MYKNDFFFYKKNNRNIFKNRLTVLIIIHELTRVMCRSTVIDFKNKNLVSWV